MKRSMPTAPARVLVAVLLGFGPTVSGPRVFAQAAVTDPGSTGREAFRAANKLYEGQDYRSAAAKYEEAIDGCRGPNPDCTDPPVHDRSGPD
jgi:hypothetical protein